MRDQGQCAACAIRLDDNNNRASSCFPLQFSHIDNRLCGRWCVWCVCVCVFLGGCSVHNRSFCNNGSRMAKKQKTASCDETPSFAMQMKGNTALRDAFFHIFLLKASSERKKQLIKPKSNPNIHRCTDSFSQRSHTLSSVCEA